jgi:hypothetical protein
MGKKMMGLVILSLLVGLAVFSTAQQRTQQTPPAAQKQLEATLKPPFITNITSIKCWNMGYYCGDISISGWGFNDKRGSRVVVVDGKPATDPQLYLDWGNTAIGMYTRFLSPIIIYDHIYKFAIGELVPQPPLLLKPPLLKILSPEFAFRFLVYWDGEPKPKAGPVGTQVEGYLLRLESPQGSQVLMMGSTQVKDIVSWTIDSCILNVLYSAPEGTDETNRKRRVP